MLTGLDILLDRMKTNPEEFLEEGRHVPYEGQQFGGKWADLVTYAWRVSTEEERKMLEDAQRQFYRDDFNERVMKRLAGEDRTVEETMTETMTIKAQGRYATGWADPRMAMQNAALQGNSGFGQAQVKGEGQIVGFGADTYLSGGGDKGFFGLGKLFGR